MDDARIGRALRELRRRRGWRQEDVAQAAGLSQSAVSLVERGHIDRLSIATARHLFAVVDAGFEGVVVWRGGAIDRILDERHAALVGQSALRLAALRFEVQLEVTYSIFGERGSIDVLAGHEPSRTVVVEEVKSELYSIEQLGRKTDEKVRLARQTLCRDRFGWSPMHVARIVVLPDTDAARRSVARHAGVLDRLLPLRGRDVTAWLRNPIGDLSGIRFIPEPRSRVRPGRGGAHRVRRIARI